MKKKPPRAGYPRAMESMAVSPNMNPIKVTVLAEILVFATRTPTLVRGGSMKGRM